MIVCTYWTNDTYRILGEECLRSAREFGLKTYGRGVEGRGEFYSNTKEKPNILLEALDVVGETDYLLWVDADCVFKQYPIALFDGYDLAAKSDGCRGVWGTVVSIRTSPLGMRVLREWANARPHERDDEAALRRALFPLRDGFKLMCLPVGYVWTEVVHRAKFPDEEIFIEHEGVHIKSKIEERLRAVKR